MHTSIFSDEHVMFRKSLRKMLEKEAYPFYDEWEKAREIPRKFWLKLGENGFLCPWGDEEYGGLGLDFSYSMILIEELERVGQGYRERRIFTFRNRCPVYRRFRDGTAETEMASWLYQRGENYCHCYDGAWRGFGFSWN